MLSLDLRFVSALSSLFLSQTKLGAQLTSLETRWTELISNVLQIELANSALEAEINDLTRKETELSSM